MSSSRNLDQGCRDLDRVGAAGDSVVAKDATTACSGIGRGAVTGQYKAYPEYRESGVEWLGKVPSHWGMLKLKRIASLLTDKANRRDYPVALENIESWTGRFILTEGDYSGEGVAFEAGDILFGKLRPYLAKVLLTEQPGEAVGDFLVLRPTGLAAAYLHRLLLTREMISLIEGSTYGAKMPRASWDFMGTIEAPIPPAQEQSTIAAFLDHETAKIDRLIAKQEELIALLKEKRQAVISHAVTKGLNPDAPMKDSGVEWIGEVPTHWQVIKFKYIAKLESGHTPSRNKPEYWVDCHIPWFTLADVWQLRDGSREYVHETKEKVSELGLANSSARLLPKDTVILSRTASVGFCAITGSEMATTQDFANWICGPKIISRFLLYSIKAMRRELDRLTMGSTHKTIYMPEIESFIGPVPPHNEQERIIAYLRERINTIDASIVSSEEIVSLLKERRTALISAAVTGKIDVRDWKPAEHAAAPEPAPTP